MRIAVSPSRAYPLCPGRLDGDRRDCGYHGFGYDPDGCLLSAVAENVPARPGGVLPCRSIRRSSGSGSASPAVHTARPRACPVTATATHWRAPPGAAHTRRTTCCCTSIYIDPPTCSSCTQSVATGYRVAATLAQVEAPTLLFVLPHESAHALARGAEITGLPADTAHRRRRDIRLPGGALQLTLLLPTSEKVKSC